MLNKIFITIILLCGIASASALDYANKKSCNIVNETYRVTIVCSLQTNNFNVRTIKFSTDKDLDKCSEVFFNVDGTYSSRDLLLDVTIFKDFDEFGVKTHVFSVKENTHEGCLFLYNAYKEAARRL